jgi:hypothetical protein
MAQVAQNFDALSTACCDYEADSGSSSARLLATLRGQVNYRQNHGTMAIPQQQAGTDVRSTEDAGPDDTGVAEDTTRQPVAGPLGQASVADTRVLERLDRLEALLNQLVQQRAVKDWYTVQEAAQLLGRAEFTVREWCRLGRVHAQKRACGRGLSQEWAISHQELERIRNEGLLPQPKTSTRLR